MQSVVSRLLDLVKSGGFAGVFGSNVFNNAISFVVSVMAARVYGPTVFGQFALAVSVTTLLAVVLDFGSGISLVRIYRTTTNQVERDTYVQTILVFKLTMLIALIPIALIAPNLTSRLLPVLASSGQMIYWSVFSAGLLSLWVSVRAIEQAKLDMRAFGWQTTLYGLIRLCSIPLLFVTDHRSALPAFLGLYTIPLTVLLCGWLVRHRSLWMTGLSELTRLGQFGWHLFSYSTWVALSAMAYNALLRLPQFVLASTAVSGPELGTFSAALTFVAFYSMVNDALRTVILPKVVSLDTVDDRVRFRQGVWRKAPLFFFAMILLLLCMVVVQRTLLDERYQQSTIVFVVLGVSTILTMFLGIMNTLVHSYGVPRLDAYVNLGRCVGLVVLLSVVPRSAFAVSVAFGFIQVGGEVWLYNMILRQKDSSSRAHGLYEGKT